MNMDSIIIVLLVLGCLAGYKAFTAQDPKQKKLYAFLALFIGGVLFVLGNMVPK